MNVNSLQDPWELFKFQYAAELADQKGIPYSRDDGIRIGDHRFFGEENFFCYEGKPSHDQTITGRIPYAEIRAAMPKFTKFLKLHRPEEDLGYHEHDAAWKADFQSLEEKIKEAQLTGVRPRINYVSGPYSHGRVCPVSLLIAFTEDYTVNISC